MPKRVLGVLLLATGTATTACILRPGMNAECAWPPEGAKALNLAESEDARHLVLDTELLEELVDRYRFNSNDEQRRCEERLIAEVARIHSVTVTDVARARARIPHRGLDFPVTVPVSVLFLFSVFRVIRWIEQRFAEERIPLTVTLAATSVTLSGLFMFVGEFWTSLLQMVRVGSQHVGGRVNKLPWLQHQTEIFAVGIVLFWTVQSLRWLSHRRSDTAAGGPDGTGLSEQTATITTAGCQSGGPRDLDSCKQSETEVVDSRAASLHARNRDAPVIEMSSLASRRYPTS